MSEANLKSKRVILVHWKKQNNTEVFSNLKYFCLSYPQYNYNTINNYLSKRKIPYESEIIRIERKNIISKPITAVSSVANAREIAPVLRRVKMKEANDEIRDWEYWLSQPVKKRAEAITFLVSQMLEDGQRMDKTFVNRIKI